MGTTFTEEDFAQITGHGIDISLVESQLRQFEQGFRHVQLDRPSTAGDGIVQLQEKEVHRLASLYKDRCATLAVTKFVPASGAASRMFRHLHEPDAFPELNEEFFANLNKLPFAGKLPDTTDCDSIVKFILEQGGLNYDDMPKALIPFHGSRTAMEEHLVEAIGYANGNVHFTVAPEHRKEMEQLAASYPHVSISFSEQQQDTNTIAVDPGGKPFRTDEGTLLFRPAGHGALLANLNELKEDMVFIKNIDNVQPVHLRSDTLLYKKALAGYLLELTDQEAPDRPVRVCGMVRNEGEPGGGPFWVRNGDDVSLQIVEQSQVDISNNKQKQLLTQSTHFNPVDLVCWMKDAQGHSFDLLRYRDDRYFFISAKTYQGRELKAMELPGLWNGAMAHWKTVFVEVPISTFTPVKTVNDLLKPEHQPA